MSAVEAPPQNVRCAACNALHALRRGGLGEEIVLFDCLGCGALVSHGEVGEGPPVRLFSPCTVGKYRLQARIASGGMGEVYRAVLLGAEGFERPVAVKKVLPHLARDEKFVKMLVREAKILVLLTHPNIVQVTELARVDEDVILVMEYVDGVSLRRIDSALATVNRLFTVDVACGAVMQLLAALDFAHNLKGPDGSPQPVLHRDISPGNVLVASSGHAKLTDFGVAKTDSFTSERTSPGIVKGKVPYLAPELVVSEPPSPQTDVYAAGVVLYELLAGRRPFTSDSDAQLMMQIASQPSPPVRTHRPDCPDAIARVVHRALERDPKRRFASARDYAEALAAAAEVPPAETIAARMRAMVAELRQENAKLDLEEAPSLEGRVRILEPGAAGRRAGRLEAPTAAGVPAEAAARSVAPARQTAAKSSMARSEATRWAVYGLAAVGAVLLGALGTRYGAEAIRAAREAEPPPAPVVAMPLGAPGLAQPPVLPSPPAALDPLSPPEVEKRGRKAAGAATRVYDELPLGVIQETVRTNARVVQPCFDRFREALPGGTGRVPFRFSIAPSGAVTDVAFADPSWPTGPLAECLAAKARRIRFPRSRLPIEVTIPLNFRVLDAVGDRGPGTGASEPRPSRLSDP